jgi:hypothetical protein
MSLLVIRIASTMCIKGDRNVSSITYFPTPLPNEDFRSVLYRYHLCSLNPEIVDTNKELFNAKTEFTVFPRALEVLLRKLPSSQNLTVETIVEKHTLLPALFPFISESRTEDIINDITHGRRVEDSCVGKLIGNKYGKCISEIIKYCPCCMEEDLSKYGCSYIHREHQYAFIQSCNTHSVDLVSQCDVCRVELMYSGIDGKCKNGHMIMHRGSWKHIDNFEKELHKDLEFLKENSKNLETWLIKQRFIEYLNARGYIKSDGKQINSKLFIRDFINAFTPKQFTRLGLDVEYISKWNAIERILRGNHDPLVINLPLTLMIISFLAGSFENFILKAIPYVCEIPFATGPWICINNRCPSYNQMKINKCTRIKNGIGGLNCKFICEDCQAGYVKVWNWSTGEREGGGNTLIYSKLKVDQVMQLLRTGSSLNEIADKLYCSQVYVRRVFKKYFKPEQQELFSAHAQVAATSELSQVQIMKRNTYRMVIKQAVELNSELTRNQIYLKNTVAYVWLRKNDSAWLELNLPPSKSFIRFDWDEVDDALAIRVKELSKQLIESNPKTRVSKYSIMGALSKRENGRLKNYIQHCNAPHCQHTDREEIS